MKIMKSQLFQVEFSLEELIVIKKLVGKTSELERKEDFGMTKEQSDAADRMYDVIVEYMGVDED